MTSFPPLIHNVQGSVFFRSSFLLEFLEKQSPSSVEFTFSCARRSLLASTKGTTSLGTHYTSVHICSLCVVLCIERERERESVLQFVCGGMHKKITVPKKHTAHVPNDLNPELCILPSRKMHTASWIKADIPCPINHMCEGGRWFFIVEKLTHVCVQLLHAIPHTPSISPSVLYSYRMAHIQHDVISLRTIDCTYAPRA